MTDPEAVGAPEASEVDEAPSRGTAVLFYALLLSVGLGFFLGPLAGLIVWRLRRGEPFLDFHGRQSLDLTLTAIVVGGGVYILGLFVAQRWLAAGSLLQWLSLGIVILQGVLAAWGLVHAAQARTVRLPLSLPWLRRQPEVVPGGDHDDA